MNKEVKKILCFVFLFCTWLFIFTQTFAFAKQNYSYNAPVLKFNSKEAYEYYRNNINEAVYKTMPRTFSYKDREPQFAITVNKTGHVDKAWILVSSGSKKYDEKVIRKMREAELPAYSDYMNAKQLTFKYKIKKQTKIIPIPIPLWF